MKMTTLLALISTAMMATSAAYAGDQAVYPQGTTLHPPKNVTTNLLHPPTDITVINASSSYIYFMIPEANISDYISPLGYDHYYNYNPNLQYSHVVLKDAYGYTLYDYMVCKLGIITVHGNPNSFTITTDNDLCN